MNILTAFIAKIGYFLLILQTTNDPCLQLQQPLTLENVLKITNWYKKKNCWNNPHGINGPSEGKTFSSTIFPPLEKKPTFAQSKC